MGDCKKWGVGYNKIHRYTSRQEKSQKKKKKKKFFFFLPLNKSNYKKIKQGGEDIVAPFLGKDATDAFFDDQTHTHSDNAESMLKDFKIGYIKENKNKNSK